MLGDLENGLATIYRFEKVFFRVLDQVLLKPGLQNL